MTMEEIKSIDLSRSVHSLCSEYPEIASIMARLGFTDIVKPGMLATAGRFMTIPKGAAMKNIDMDKIKAALIQNGFELKEGIHE